MRSRLVDDVCKKNDQVEDWRKTEFDVVLVRCWVNFAYRRLPEDHRLLGVGGPGLLGSRRCVLAVS